MDGIRVRVRGYTSTTPAQMIVVGLLVDVLRPATPVQLYGLHPLIDHSDVRFVT